MLDGLLGRGFSSKCKSSIKLIKARIDVIRRKRNAMQKFLKKDIADLLANNLEINAYGRAEGLIVELNLSFCYDLIEQFCGSIPRHLSVMQKQSECPEEIREAVASLMFAAARFADLPELRDLRQMFTEKYGNSLEPFLNREFSEKLSSDPPTVDQKLQLMRDIAKEYSVKWDSKDFQLKVSNPLASLQDRPNRHGSFRDYQNGGNKVVDTAVKKHSEDVLSRGRPELTNDVLKPQKVIQETVSNRIMEDISRGRQQQADDGYKARGVVAEKTVIQDISSNGTPENVNNSFKPRSSRDATAPKRDNQEVWSRRRREHTVDGNQRHDVVEDTVPKRDVNGVPSQGRQRFPDDGFIHRNGREDIVQRENMDISSRGRRKVTNDEDGTMLKKEDRRGRRELTDDGFNLQNDRKEDEPHMSSNGRQEHAKTEKNGEEAEAVNPQYKGFAPPPYVRPNGGKYGTRKETSEPKNNLQDPPVYRRDVNVKPEKTLNERHEFRPARVKHMDENEYSHHDDLVSDRIPKPKPTSVRRRHLKPPPGYENPISNEGDEGIRRIPSARRRDARMGLQHALDEDRNDVKDEEEKMMDHLLMHYSKKPAKFEPVRVKEGLRLNAPPPSNHDANERHHRPYRAVSLPKEPVTPTTEVGKAPIRATSFQHERDHVHPKLPEYEDLAARIASLRER